MRTPGCRGSAVFVRFCYVLKSHTGLNFLFWQKVFQFTYFAPTISCSAASFDFVLFCLLCWAVTRTDQTVWKIKTITVFPKNTASLHRRPSDVISTSFARNKSKRCARAKRLSIFCTSNQLSTVLKINLATIKPKSNLHYTRGITPKRVTSSGAHLCGLTPGQHSSKETWQRWRAVCDIVSDLTDPGIEPQIYRTDSDVLTSELTSANSTSFFFLFSYPGLSVLPKCKLCKYWLLIRKACFRLVEHQIFEGFILFLILSSTICLVSAISHC